MIQEGEPGEAATITVGEARELVRETTLLLDAAGVASPRSDAEALVAWGVGVPRLEWVRLDPDGTLLTGEEATRCRARLAAAIDRRRAREPLQRILGHTVFRHLTLQMAPGVFVPRPESEVVAQIAIDEARQVGAAGRSALVVDLCAGSGALAVSVAVEVPGTRVVAVDISPAAVRATCDNAVANGVSALGVVEGDVRDPQLLADLAGQVDVVVSNPPYVPATGAPLEPEVALHDPALALWGGGPDGLELPRAVVTAAARLLRDGGLLVMEHAESQASLLAAEVADTAAWGEVASHRDLTGRPRMLVARRSRLGSPPATGHPRVTDSRL